MFAATFVSLAFSGGTYWDLAPHILEDPGKFGLFPRSFSDFSLRLQAGLPFAVWLIAILGAHEMGHYVACRRYGILATWPYFLPAPFFRFGTFGAVIRVRSPFPHRRALFDVAIAGPIAGLVVAIVAMVVGIRASVAVPPDLEVPGGLVFSLPWLAAWLADALRPGESLTMNGTLAAAWGGLLVTALNLFPAGQLDGGHIAYAVSRRVHRAASRAAIVLAAASVAWAGFARQPPMYLLWLGILLWMRDRHPPVGGEHETLGRFRGVLALLAALLFALCFTWFPVKFVD